MAKNIFNEVELLKASIKGNNSAFEGLVNKYQSLICAITYGGTGDIGKSEELAQETFVKAWKDIGQLRELTKFKAWLCSIARTTVVNYLRSENRNVIKNAAPLEAAGAAASEASEPSNELIAREQRAVVSQALLQLPESYREPLILYYRHDQSTKEVAEQLELSEDNVRTRLSRGRKMLKEQVVRMVENTLSSTAPGKMFTAAVMASVAGVVLKGSSAATSAASGVSAGSTTSAVITSITGGLTAKILAAAAVIVIGIAAFVTYNHFKDPEQTPNETAAAVYGQSNITSETPEAAFEKPQEVTKRPEKTTSTPADIVAVVNNGVKQISPAFAAKADVDEEFVFAPKGVLSGLITDIETGEPVTDATVTIWMGRYHTVKTDKNGFYSFDEIEQNGNYKIRINSKAYIGICDYNEAPIMNLVKGKQAVKHFQLEKACLIELLVADENDRPVKDAILWATCLSDDHKREVNGDLNLYRTDPNGVMLMGGFRASEDSYLITARHRVDNGWGERNGHRYVKTTGDFAYAKLIVKLTDPDVIEHGKIVMKKGVAVKGFAMYSDGEPAGDLKISAYPQWWHSHVCPESYPIDPNGHFTIPYVDPGMYSIQISIPYGDDGASMGYNVMQAELPLKNDDLLLVKLPQKSPNSLVSLSGVIKFAGNKRPRSVFVSANSKQGSPGSADLTERNGKLPDVFVIDRLEPGTYKVTFSGLEIETKTIDNVKVPGDVMEVELKYYEKPKLNGVVVETATGKPVNHFKARAIKVKHLRGQYYVKDRNFKELNNTDGKFNLDLVGPGVYQVQIAAEGYVWGFSNEVNTDEGGEAKVELTEGGSIAGKVVDANGEPISGAMIVPLSRVGKVWSKELELFVLHNGSVRSVDGEFVLSNLASGTETLRVVHPNYSNLTVEGIKVVEGETTGGVEIVMDNGGIVEGYVYNAAGKPLANETLYFQDDSGYSGGPDEQAGRIATVITDPNGYYIASGLPEQMCYVTRRNSWSQQGVVRRAIVPVKGKVSRLHFGGNAIVSGRLVVDGEESFSTRVSLTATDNPNFGSFMCLFTTGENGEFVFGGVPYGVYSIYYENPQKRGDWIKVDTISVAGDDLDLGVIPKKTPLVRVTVETEEKKTGWKIDDLYVQEGDKAWSQRVAKVKVPGTDGEPYVISKLTPGRYTIAAMRQDRVTFRKEIEVSDKEIDVTFAIEKCSASISGRLDESLKDGTCAWRKDKKVVAYIKGSENGSFKVDNLPAGEYLVGGGMLMNDYAYMEFKLAAGEHKKIDLAQPEDYLGQNAVIVAIVLDKNGVPIAGATAWLEDVSGKVIEPTTNASNGIHFIASEGKYTLCAVYSGYKKATLEVEMRSKDMKVVQSTFQRVYIRLEPERLKLNKR